MSGNLDSRIHEFLAFEIQNSAIANDWNPESSRKKMESNTFGNPELTELESRIHYAESGYFDCSE